MPDIDVIIDHNGQERMLARLQPTSDHMKMRAARTNFKDYLSSIGKSLIPRDQWKPVNRRAYLGVEFINDQKQCSGCVGWSAAQGFMRARALKGMTFRKLSGAYIYAQINGGRDQGSVIVDAMAELESTGTCLESEFNYPKIYQNQIPAGAGKTAKRFKLGRGLTCDTFDEAGTAILMGLIVQFPIMVGSAFEQFHNGIAGFTKGYGNHSVHADGIDFIENKWVLDMPNSWGLWGPEKNGRCYIEEKAFAGQGGADDSYIHIDPIYDPMDENLPPAPVVSGQYQSGRLGY